MVSVTKDCESERLVQYNRDSILLASLIFLNGESLDCKNVFLMLKYVGAYLNQSGELFQDTSFDEVKVLIVKN